MNYMLVIAGMTIVTYIPRLLPLSVLSKRPMPPVVRRFLMYIPFTALGALLFPGVFKSIPEKPIAAVLGIVFAVIFAWVRGGLVFPVAAAILASFLSINFL